MTFSSDMEKFTLKAASQIEDALAAKKVQRDSFLLDFLGDEAATIKRYEFDSTVSRFYEVDAPDSVINKLREAGYLRETEQPSNIG